MTKFIKELERVVNWNIQRVEGYKENGENDEFDSWYIEAMKQVLVDIEQINKNK